MIKQRETVRPIFDRRNRWAATAVQQEDRSWRVFIGARDVGVVADFEAAAALVERITNANEKEAGA